MTSASTRTRKVEWLSDPPSLQRFFSVDSCRTFLSSPDDTDRSRTRTLWSGCSIYLIPPQPFHTGHPLLVSAFSHTYTRVWHTNERTRAPYISQLPMARNVLVRPHSDAGGRCPHSSAALLRGVRMPMGSDGIRTLARDESVVSSECAFGPAQLEHVTFAIVHETARNVAVSQRNPF